MPILSSRLSPGSQSLRARRIAAAILLIGSCWNPGCDGDLPAANGTGGASDTPKSESAAGVTGAPEQLPGTGPEPPGRQGGSPRSGELGRDQRPLTPEQKRVIEQLEAIGYLGGTERPVTDALVATHDRARVYAGLNFHVSGHGPTAILRDMDGRVLHRWRYPFQWAWPDREIAPYEHFWRRAHLFENGDLLAIYEGRGIIKVDRRSELIWSNPVLAHHDLQVMPDGDIYVLTRAPRLIPRIDPERPLIEDFITVLGSDGREKRSVSILECMENSEYVGVFRESFERDRNLDPIHPNSLEVLTGEFAERAPWFARGNVLTSFRILHMIAVIDPEQKKIVKAWTGDFRLQHDPKILRSGNLLFFDNAGRDDRSRVIEMDPLSGRTVWSYPREEDDPFYSKFLGTAQRLANGNTLITESDRGRVFEITAGGEIVWEFHNPARTGRGGQFIASLPEVVRLAPDFTPGWLPHAR